jgi:hypothetical protein
MSTLEETSLKDRFSTTKDRFSIHTTEKPSYLKSPPSSKIKAYIDQPSNWKLCKLGAE